MSLGWQIQVEIFDLGSFCLFVYLFVCCFLTLRMLIENSEQFGIVGWLKSWFCI